MHYYTWLATKDPINEDNYWNYMEKYFYDNNKTEFVDETENVIKGYNSNEKRKIRKTNFLHEKCGFEFIYDSPWDKDIVYWTLKDYIKQGNWSINRFFSLLHKLPINKTLLTAQELELFDMINDKYRFNDPLSITFKVEQSDNVLLKDFLIIKKLVKAINKQCPIIELTMQELYPNIEDYVNNYHDYTIEIINDEPRYGYWVNPDSLFDWCVIGGRWRGGLISKMTQVGIDSCIKTDLDLDKMSNQWVDYLSEEFNKDKDLQACYAHLDEYLQIHKHFYPNTLIIDTGEYHNKWKHLHLLSYEKRDRNHNRLDLLKDDKQDQIKHNQIMQELFDKLPDNYYITIIDMHN